LQPERDVKAELNRRSQACEVLAGTGVRVAEKWLVAPQFADRGGSPFWVSRRVSETVALEN
jgi:hypothetical protein